jgi:hypothetical protein
MSWKAEHWLAEVFPGKENIFSTYRELQPRELAIVSAAVLDAALVELLSLRLSGPQNEIEEFLGVNGDGRAPAGSFGARIQLAVLVGLLTENDAALLRIVKQIRNLFAHRVIVDFLTPQVLNQTRRLLGLWRARCASLSAPETRPKWFSNLDIIQENLPKVPQAGEGLLTAVFVSLQAYFHLMHPKVQKLDRPLRFDDTP